MVKVERTSKAPLSLAIQKEKPNGSYRERDVVELLLHDFNNKCYLCNHAGLMDIQIEHLLPHHNGKYPDLQFDWNNLFLSCPHCNGVKNAKKYDRKIINCCEVDPEQFLDFYCEATTVYINTKIEDDESVHMTASLLNEIFNKNNLGIRTHGANMRVKKLQEEMNVLYRCLEMYHNNPTSKRNLAALRSLLKREGGYAAFKRAYVRRNFAHYPDLQTLVTLTVSSD